MDINQGIKIILLGESGVGKTNLINAFFNYEFEKNPDSTIASFGLEREYKYKNSSYTYTIWDTAGQEKYRSINKMIIRGSKIILIVYSIISRQSFNEINFWMNFIKENLGNDKCIIALVANKSDLYEKQIVMDEEGKEAAKKYGIDFLTTSALTERKKFQDFINKLITIYIEKYIRTVNDTDTKGNKNIKIKGEKKEIKKKCC